MAPTINELDPKLTTTSDHRTALRMFLKPLMLIRDGPAVWTASGSRLSLAVTAST
jgi:hypothetical protein